MASKMQTNIKSIDGLPVVSCLKVLKPLVNTSAKTSLRLLAIFGERGSAVIFATTDDEVYGYGDNRFGCLGVGTDDKQIPEPRLNPTLSGKQVVNIYYGFGHCLALIPSGQVYTWGENDFGQLGVGTFDSTPTPLLIEALANRHVVDIACGNRHTLALTREGQVYGWGRNTFGQVGDYTFNWRVTPVRLPIHETVVSISCGKCHSVAVSESGRVFLWGLNDFGQLGRHRDRDLRLGKERAISNRPELIAGFEKTVFKKAVCGPNHTMLLTADGLLYAVGHNDWGQIGNGNQDIQWTPVLISSKIIVKDIVTTYDNNLSIALGDNNKFYVWGYPYYYKKISRPHAADIQPSDGHTVFDVYVKYSGSFRTFKTIVFNDETKEESKTAKPVTNGQKYETMTDIDGTGDGFSGLDSGFNAKDDDWKSTTSRSLLDCSLDEMNETMGDLSVSTTPMDIFNRHLRYAFNNTNNYDLVFAFDNEHIYCHKTILKIRNKKFWEICDNYLFNNLNVVHNSIIRIKSHSYEAFYAFVEYLYGRTPDISADIAAEVCKLATLYDEPTLKQLCADQGFSVTEETIDLSNICRLYEKAINENEFDLEKSCIEFAANNLIPICKSDAFRALPEYVSKRFMLSVCK